MSGAQVDEVVAENERLRAEMASGGGAGAGSAAGERLELLSKENELLLKLQSQLEADLSQARRNLQVPYLDSNLEFSSQLSLHSPGRTNSQMPDTRFCHFVLCERNGSCDLPGASCIGHCALSVDN